MFAEAGFSLDRCCAFLAIIEAQGISQAASGNPSRQSQLSRQLGELETWLGSKLVIRGRGRFALTESGQTLAGLLNSYFSGLQHLKAASSRQLPVIRIGSGESILQWLVVPTLARLSLNSIKIQAHLSNLRSEAVIAGLLDGALEFGILRHGNLPKRLRSVQITKIDHAVFVSSSLAKQCAALGRAIPLAGLELGSHLDDIFHTSDQGQKKYEISMRCSSLAQAAEFVRQGLTAAVLPRLAKLSMPADIQIEPLRTPASQMSLWLAWEPRIDVMLPEIALFRERFVESARKFLEN